MIPVRISQLCTYVARCLNDYCQHIQVYQCIYIPYLGNFKVGKKWTNLQNFESQLPILHASYWFQLYMQTSDHQCFTPPKFAVFGTCSDNCICQPQFFYIEMLSCYHTTGYLHGLVIYLGINIACHLNLVFIYTLLFVLYYLCSHFTVNLDYCYVSSYHPAMYTHG